MELAILHFINMSQAKKYKLSEIIDKSNINAYLREKGFHKTFKSISKELDKKNKVYQYMLTFTCDPKKVDVEDEVALASIEDEVLRLVQKPVLSIVRSEYVREGTDEDHKHAHWHVGVVSKKFMKKEYFKSYIKNIGRIDISKSVENNFLDILLYINKCYESTTIVQNHDFN